MKAVIMAGGEGSRLRPLTCDLPKPMARLCGRPIMEYILDLLCRHGIQEAAVTLRYLPDRVVEHFPDGRYRDLRLEFVEEDEPLGTAGSVRGACGSSEQDVLVISGDALCDFDLTAAICQHKATQADVTILAKRVEDPREYGLIVDGADGRITAFVEKPAYSQAISDLANTGIYILSPRALKMIPVQRSFDFARDLFPKMLEQNMRLLCREDPGYWCDIGDLETYVRCQRDLLEGRVDCDLHGEKDAQGNRWQGKPPRGEYTLVPPVYIGNNVQIGDGVRIESGSVIDDGCSIAPAARVSGSVLLPNSFVGRRARLTGALLCSGASVGPSAMLFEGSAVGAGAIVGEKSTVNAGIKIWNNKAIPPSVNVVEHVKLGGERRGVFGDKGITGQVGVELTPEFCARIGAAVGSLFPDLRIGIAHAPHRSGEVLAAAVAAGIQSTGASVIDFGESFQAQFEFSVNFASLKAGIFVSGGTRAFLHVVGAGGLPAERALERNIEAVLARGEFVRRGWNEMGDNVPMSGISMLYKSQLIRCAPKGLAGLGATVRSRSLPLQTLLQDTLRGLSCDKSEQLILQVSARGNKVRAHDAVHGYIPHHKILSICAVWQMQQGEDVALPFDAPRILDDVAARTGRRLLRYYTCPADDSDAEARNLAQVQMWSRDGLMQAILFLHIVRQSGGVENLLAEIPVYERASRTLEIAGNPASLMRRLEGDQSSPAVTEGVVLQQEDGIVLVRPLKQGTGLRILAEAHSSETAAELCDFVEGMLELP